MKTHYSEELFKKKISKKLNLIQGKNNKKISFNIETLSTTGNLKSLNSKRNHNQNSKIIEKHLDIDSSQRNIKKELYEKINENINSPSKKAQYVRFSITGGLPKLRNKNIDKSSFTSVQSSNSNPIYPKKLSKKRIEIEKMNIKNFMKRSVFGMDEQTIHNELKIPKSNKHATNYREFMINRRIDKLKEKDYALDSDRQKHLESNVLNPSLGPEYLKKKYPNIAKQKLWNFENKFKSNYSKKLLGSILFAKRIQKEDDSKKYENVKNAKFLQVSKLKMKWKTIKWILDNKKDVLDRLMDFHENIFKITNKQNEQYDKGMTKSEFTMLMKRNGITKDVGLINKLFWVFDEDGDNDLRYKEIAFGIEMFRDSSIEQKLKAFFDLCDVDNSGSISKLEFFNLMKKNIINNDEKMSMKDVVDKIFSSVKLDKNGDITFEQLKEGCEKNKEIQSIIYKNLLALKSIDNVIDKDVKKDIMQFNPELNDQLRMKLLSMKISYTPLREEKFTRLLNDFVSNRERLIDIKKQLEVKEEESYELNEEDSSLFKEESDLIKPLMNKISFDQQSVSVTNLVPEKKELRINSNENAKRVMYLIKEFLLNNDYVDLVSGTGGAPVSVRASESLVRLGYVTYECVRTDTTLANNRRRTKLIVRIRKTKDFKLLYDENEEIRKKTQEILNKTD